MSQLSITPYGGDPGSVVYIQAPPNSNLYFSSAKTLLLTPFNTIKSSGRPLPSV
jgi:hypothetical protein